MKSDNPQVFVVDDEAPLVHAIGMLLDAHRMPHRGFTSPRTFLRTIKSGHPGCILLDVRMPEMSGLEVQDALRRRGCRQPVIFLTGHGDIPMAVRATRAGALDFLEKPARRSLLMARIRAALKQDRKQRERMSDLSRNARNIATLTPRERQVLELLAQGLSSQKMAKKLRLSPRTVEMHRLRMMRRLGVKNTAQAVRMILEAGGEA
ncbi:MAG TPA: response regulator [Kiritimatiellia bacterium]|nr:response regulator [Kiritimatiellia bacterium]HMP00379.1 response regulator [Kiritimatiellia bacterium]